MKKELKDLRIHDLLDDPKLKEAFRRAKPKHWSELTEDEREAQAKEQAEAEQEFVREQRFLRVKRVLQSIIEAKCNEPNSRLFTTAEELLEFVVKYESSPSSVSNYEWNKFETILLTRLESLLQADGKEEEPTETEQGNKNIKKQDIPDKEKWYQNRTIQAAIIGAFTLILVSCVGWYIFYNSGETSNIFAYVSKDGTILRSKNFPWSIRKTKDEDGNTLYSIEGRSGDPTALSVFPDNLIGEYSVRKSYNGMVIIFTCAEEKISNFKVEFKY
ncbi:hypothetical protein KA005_79075 [bacterium]|nr:hypothetical protein [bacterium]